MASGQAKLDIEYGLAEIRRKTRLYVLYRNYYEGLHRLAFATKDWKNEFGSIFSAFADNLCPTVIGAVKNRLSIIGFSSQGEEGEVDKAGRPASRPLLRRGSLENDEAGDAAWSIWNRNRMDRRQKELYREALIGGDCAAIVWTHPENERQALIHPQKPDKVAVRYSEEIPGQMLYAVKAWIQEDKRTRVTVYYPDRIERWQSPGGSQGGLPDKADRLVPYDGKRLKGPDPDVPEPFEIPNPIDRVPVAVFAYDAVTGERGRSRLTDVVPLQDALNKAVADMLVAAEFQAVPQRVVIGWQPTEFDELGNPKPPWKSGADRILTIASETAKVTQFDAANLSAFIAEQDSFRAEVARVSQTPLHYLLLSGEFPSGDALHAAEAPLDAVVDDTKDSFGSSNEELMDICLRFERGSGAMLTSLWRDTKAKSEKAHAETVQIRRALGASRKQGLREIGYSDAEIDEMDEEELEEKLGEDASGAEPAPPPVPGAAGLAAVERAAAVG